MRPVTLPSYIRRLYGHSKEEMTAEIKKNYAAISQGDPLVTVVIPAYNEEKNILLTLLSITRTTTTKPVEIIVVNNNSSDNTGAMVKATGIPCLLETIKGPTAARTMGLGQARGTYILNADADSIYPPGWIDLLIDPLHRDDKVALAYGRFAFLPGEQNGRFAYFLYEQMADVLRWSKKKFKEEAMNVYGCNSGFRRQQCLQVNGYEHPPGTNEDGWLAVKLRDKGFGRLHQVRDAAAIVWTVDRHLMNDGGLWKALRMRIGQALFNK